MNDDTTFWIVVALVFCLVIGAMTAGAWMDESNRQQDQQEAVDAGKAEWYWDKDGNKKWRLLEEAD